MDPKEKQGKEEEGVGLLFCFVFNREAEKSCWRRRHLSKENIVTSIEGAFRVVIVASASITHTQPGTIHCALYVH